MALLSSSVTSPATTSTEQTPLSTQETIIPQSNPQTQLQKDETMDEAMDVSESDPEFMNNFQDSDIADYIAKYNKYEADYVRRIKAKYFSKKAMNGGNIFDEETTIEDEIIKSSRWPCTKTFIEPVQSSEEQSRSSSSAAETSTNVPNRKYQCKKSS